MTNDIPKPINKLQYKFLVAICAHALTVEGREIMTTNAALLMILYAFINDKTFNCIILGWWALSRRIKKMIIWSIPLTKRTIPGRKRYKYELYQSKLIFKAVAGSSQIFPHCWRPSVLHNRECLVSGKVCAYLSGRGGRSVRAQWTCQYCKCNNVYNLNNLRGPHEYMKWVIEKKNNRDASTESGAK